MAKSKQARLTNLTVFSGTSSKSLSEISDMSYDKDCLEIM